MSAALAEHWLVPTIAATACWALSDVCCDACIGQAAAGEDGGSSSPRSGGTPDAAALKSTPAARASDLSECAADDAAGAEALKRRRLLTPEQNAVLSAGVALCACAVATGYRFYVSGDHLLSAGAGRDRAVAAGAGAVHFFAYAVELRAYRTASSTVITPLLQLSAVWMVVLRSLTPLLATFGPAALQNAADDGADGGPRGPRSPLYAASSTMHPAHLLAIGCIFVGGFLPAARGRVSRFAEAAFYRQPAVRCCVFGELLICVYNALLHATTFDRGPDAVLRFFAVSRLGNGAACLACVALGLPGFSPADVSALRRVEPRAAAIGVAGEVLSVVGVCVVMFSYARFHEPAVVNAAEGGVQQLLNLCFASALAAVGFGRAVDDRPTKLVSFALVSAGLVLSTAIAR